MQRAARLKNIASALKIYLENAKQYDKMMVKEREAFESGKRHLANMMGWQEGPILQKDINRAIEYLLPSGLTGMDARPQMKPPEEIFPRFKKMAFDAEGRPAEHLFYTIRPKFYKLLSEINQKTVQLVRRYDEERLKEMSSDVERWTPFDSEEEPSSKAIAPAAEDISAVLSGTEWITRDQLAKRNDGEGVSEDMYASLIIALDYLASLPNAHLERDFIMQQRYSVTHGKTGTGVSTGPTASDKKAAIFGCRIPPVQVDEQTGRRFTLFRARIKKTFVDVRVDEPGSGQITVDYHHYDEFRRIQSREILISPMVVTGLLGKVDVKGVIIEGSFGTSIVPRALRHGTALGLAALFPDTTETLRLAGLLTADPRRKERKKINQPGARSKWIWKRR